MSARTKKAVEIAEERRALLVEQIAWWSGAVKSRRQIPKELVSEERAYATIRFLLETHLALTKAVVFLARELDALGLIWDKS